MNVLGLSFFYHDSSAALVQDGVLVAAAEEERFSRLKHDSGFPALAIQFCLKMGGLTIRTGDLIHADRHGVQGVPLHVAREVPAAADKIFAREHRIIDYCKSPEFTPQGLKSLMSPKSKVGSPKSSEP